MKSLLLPFVSLGIFLITPLVIPSLGFSQDYVPNEVIVKLKKTASVSTFSQKLFSKAGVADATIKRSWTGLNMHRMSLKAGLDAKQYAAYLKTQSDVEYAEPNYYVTKQSTEVDPSSISTFAQARMTASALSSMGNSSNHSTSNADGSLNQGSSLSDPPPTQNHYLQSDAPIQAEEAWLILSPSKPDVIVAIIDSGVDYNHDVFTESDAIWNNSDEIPGNGIDDDHNGYIDDVRGWNFVSRNNNPMDDSNHGTHVAGIVLGASQNIFAATLSPAKIKIMPLKFLDSQGRGTTSDAISAIMYAINNGAHVLNNSWGGGGFSQALRDAVLASYDANRVFIVAAGNSAANNDVAATYPANYNVPNIVSIAATNDYDNLASFSNYGKQTVHVGSPGQAIYSTLPGNSVGYMSGTSMAAPLAAGLAALVLRENPTASSFQVASMLNYQSNIDNKISGKVLSDARINLYKAVSFAKSGNASIYADKPSASGERGLASEPAEKSSGGCAALMIGSGIGAGSGTGTGSGGLNSFSGNSTENLRFFGMLTLLISPILLLLYLKKREDSNSPSYRRKFDRYNVSTQVTFSVGGKEMVGSVSSISLGGVKLDTEALLEQGGLVQMKIMSPDGKECLEVSGQVVWSAKEESYGVAFTKLGDRVRSTIADWQQNLIKAA